MIQFEKLSVPIVIGIVEAGIIQEEPAFDKLRLTALWILDDNSF